MCKCARRKGGGEDCSAQATAHIEVATETEEWKET
jgi:hypothetical protein